MRNLINNILSLFKAKEEVCLAEKEINLIIKRAGWMMSGSDYNEIRKLLEETEVGYVKVTTHKGHEVALQKGTSVNVLRALLDKRICKSRQEQYALQSVEKKRIQISRLKLGEGNER